MNNKICFISETQTDDSDNANTNIHHQLTHPSHGVSPLLHGAQPEGVQEQGQIGVGQHAVQIAVGLDRGRREREINNIIPLNVRRSNEIINKK